MAEEQRRLYERAIDAVGKGIVICDATKPDVPVAFINRAFLRMTGYTAEELLGRNMRLLQGPGTSRRTIRELHEAIVVGEPCSVRILNYRKDGTRFWNELNIYPVRDETGRLTHFVGIADDVTERKKAEDERERLLATLRYHERRREEWISIIAHDLRQPVTVIASYAGLLRQVTAAEPLPPGAVKAVDHIRTAAINLSKMIADLLDASRIETRRLTIERRTVDLPTLVRSVVERLSDAMIGRTVRVEVKGPVQPIEIDPMRIEQVLANLLSNAHKYGYPETDITVVVRPRAHDVEVSVTNWGPGIAPAQIPRIFTRFYRSPRAQVQQAGAGLGLGLYIARGLVEAHGGRIWAESEPGKETTFRFTLPLSAGRRSRQPRATASA